MKFTKKLFVGLVLVAVLVSGLVLSSSAEFNEANIEDILEYYTYPDFLIENFDGATTGVYTDLGSGASDCSYTVGYNRLGEEQHTVVDVDGNKMLQIYDPMPLDNRYEFSFVENYVDQLVTSVRFKTSAGEDELGSALSLFIFAHDADSAYNPNPRLRTLMFNCNSEDPAKRNVKYLSISEDGQYNEETVLENFTPALDTWYKIDAVYNLPEDQYTITITNEADGTTATITQSLGTLEYVDTAYITVRCYDKMKTSTYTWLDDVKVYSGSFVRYPENKNAETATALLGLQSLANGSATLETKVRIADVLKVVVYDNAYTPAADTENKSLVEAAIQWAKPFVYDTYVDAITTYASQIDTASNYYDRMDHIALVSKFDSILPDDADALLALAGVAASDVATVAAAKTACENEINALVKVKSDSEAFIDAMVQYDPTIRSFDYIKDTYDAISVYTDRDAAYRYTLKYEDEVPVYATVADAEVQFTELAEKKNGMETAANTFIQGVDEMASAGKTQFGNLYSGYVKAYAKYNNGILHPAVDNDSFTGLVDAIEIYLIWEEYVLGRVAESEAFIACVEMANASSYYVTIEGHLDDAAIYIDEDLENCSVEDEYAGVLEAKALYEALRQKLAQDVVNANAYISAVNEIAGKTTFTDKKAAVESALALKQTGDVIGLEGVKEANKLLSDALAEIEYIEGCSQTLIETVAKLKNATTLAERLKLINIGMEYSPKAEASISGVSAARADLTALIEQYNSDINTLNSAFLTSVKNASGLAKLS